VKEGEKKKPEKGPSKETPQEGAEKPSTEN
jgi:hypothetical protein